MNQWSRLTAEDRFWQHVLVVENCWVWTGTMGAGGYARFKAGERQIYVHRFAYELRRGPIPAGLTLDHLCRNRACVNPDHLEPVTMRENGLRGTGQAARHFKSVVCKRGHALDGELKGQYGHKIRRCLTCLRADMNRRNEKRREQRRTSHGPQQVHSDL